MTIMTDGTTLDISDVLRVARQQEECNVAAESMTQAGRTRAMFEDIVHNDIPVYGVTTGYGEMVYMLVETSREVELQTNLVRSHCAGVGPLFGEAEARAMMLARLNALSKGYSAVRPELLERLATYLNLGVTPAIPQIGSLGASGDLAPLSHIAITLIGEGYVLQDGRRVPTEQVLKERGIEPLQLRFKEGLALINGTSAMTGLSALVVADALEQVQYAEIASALIVEVLQGSLSPFQPEGHDDARPHPGQVHCAANLRMLLHGSQLAIDHATLRDQVVLDAKAEGAANRSGKRHGERRSPRYAQPLSAESGVQRSEQYLQKAYTLRAIPQVLGAVRDTLYHARRTVETELNSANDNPLFFEGKEVFHGANFHGQPLAFAMDFTTIALTQLGVMSERRTNRLLNRHLSGGLPEFLVKGEPGLNSGFAGAQYPATALIAENRTIGPASTQSVPSNGDNQDVVSMGLIAARNASRVLKNNRYILAVELLAAAQAVDLIDGRKRLSPAGRMAYDAIRASVPVLERDRFMADDIERISTDMAKGNLLRELREAGHVLQ